jgi:hypothetical protein
MVCQAGFDPWRTTIMPPLSPLSKPPATVLALGSLGMVLARSCALTVGSHLRAQGMQRTEQTVRQHLRAWYSAPPRKRGPKRHALPVEPCCAPFLGGREVVAGPPLALASAATTVGHRLVVLAVSVVDRGCAMPVAEVILPAGTPHAWRREGLRLLRRLHRAIPRAWPVIVLAARGLDAPCLVRRLTRLGGHPLVRINTGGSVRPAGATGWGPFCRLVPQPGPSWRGAGIALTRTQVPCTLRARWADGYQAAWLLLTDLAPEASDAGWYGLHAWIEQGGKSTKRAGGGGRAVVVTAQRRGGRRDASR